MITSPKLYQQILHQSHSPVSRHQHSNSIPNYPDVPNTEKVPSLKTRRFDKADYEPSENIFYPQDMPPSVRQRKQDVDRYVDSDILERYAKEWDSSVNLSERTGKPEIGLRTALVKAKHGAFKLPEIGSPSPKKPIKLKYLDIGKDRGTYMGWVFEHEYVGKFRRDLDVEKATHTAMQETRKFFDQIEGEYRTPQRKVKEFNEALRELKRDQKKREKFENQVKRQDPYASPVAVNRMVFQKLIEYQKGLNSVRSPSKSNKKEPIKWSESTSVKTERKVYNEVDRTHTGKWGVNRFSKGQEVWSCCMNKDKDSEGCTSSRKRPIKWDLLGVY